MWMNYLGQGEVFINTDLKNLFSKYLRKSFVCKDKILDLLFWLLGDKKNQKSLFLDTQQK